MDERYTPMLNSDGTGTWVIWDAKWQRPTNLSSTSAPWTFDTQVEAEAQIELLEMDDHEHDMEAEKIKELGIDDAMESFKPRANSQGWVTPTRAKLLRYLFDRKVVCSECKTVFTAELGKRNIHQLKFLYGDRAYHTVIDDPDYLKVDLECLFCNHRGVMELRPNPFMDDKNIEEYARIVQEETI